MSNQPKPVTGANQFGRWAKAHGVGVITAQTFLNNVAKMVDNKDGENNNPFQIQVGNSAIVIERSDPYGNEEGHVSLKSVEDLYMFQRGFQDTPEIEIRASFQVGGLGNSFDGSNDMNVATTNAADFIRMYFETQAEGTVDGWVEFLSTNLYSESGVLVTREKAAAWIAGKGFVEIEKG